MPTVNETYWGKPYIMYDTFNLRTGASDLTDSDYTDFPPFVLNDFRYEQSISPDYSRATLRQAQNENSPQHTYWTPNNPYPDLSIAYCGIKNRNLPQCNVRGYGTFPQSAAYDYSDLENNYCFRTDPDDIKPVMFVSNYRYQMYRADYNTYSNLPVNEFYNPYAGTSPNYTNGRFLWSPNTRDEPTNPPQRNTTYDTAYYRSIGLRTIFGVIMVQYYDTTSELHATRKIPTTTHTKSLIDYESQTTAWKETKKIVRVYMNLYYRSSTTGLYVRVDQLTTIKDSIVVDSIYGLKANTDIITGLSEDDVSIYAPCYAYTNGTTNGNLPIFGLRHSTNTGYSQIGTNANGGMSSGNYVIIYGADMGTFKHGVSAASYERMVWREIDGDADLDFFRNAAAAYGLFFTDGVATDSGYADLFAEGHDTDRWYNDKMCLGVVDNNGYTDGTYTRGLLNVTAPNWGWSDTTQSPYDPTKPPVPVMSYDSTTTFNDISNIATLTRRYALTKQDVEDLGSELWQISSDIINNIQNDEWYKYTADVMDTFLVTDPLSCIVSLQKYPMTIPEQSGPVNIKLGKAETSISANITKATAKTYYFTPVSIIPRFGNSFMDYEPYTHFELYVPFCGTTELDPRDILGRTLSVNLVVDFNTGTCVAYVLSDSLVIETINGSLAIDIPVTGVDSTTIASNITQGIINTRNARYTHQFGTLGKVASPSGIVSNIGNVWGSAQSILTSENNAKLSEYELTHQPAQPHVIGSASPVGSWAIDFKCRLLIYYPTGGIVDESKVADSSQPTAFDSTVFEQYQTQIGFATVDPVSSLGASYAHTLVCAEKAILNNVTTPNGRPATEPELQLIRQALQEGVILP